MMRFGNDVPLDFPWAWPPARSASAANAEGIVRLHAGRCSDQRPEMIDQRAGRSRQRGMESTRFQKMREIGDPGIRHERLSSTPAVRPIIAGLPRRMAIRSGIQKYEIEKMREGGLEGGGDREKARKIRTPRG